MVTDNGGLILDWKFVPNEASLIEYHISVIWPFTMHSVPFCIQAADWAQVATKLSQIPGRSCVMYTMISVIMVIAV